MRASMLSMPSISIANPVARQRPVRTLERMPRSPDAVSGALESLLSRYRDSVVHVARRHGLSDHLLDEAVQELRIRLWRTFPGSEQLAAVSAGYLYRAAVTAALIVLRRRRAKRESGIELTPHFEETTRAREAEAGWGSRRLLELPSARRAVVRLHLRGYHRDEIAALLGWSEARTRNLLYRGLDDLRAVLTDGGSGTGVGV